MKNCLMLIKVLEGLVTKHFQFSEERVFFYSVSTVLILSSGMHDILLDEFQILNHHMHTLAQNIGPLLLLVVLMLKMQSNPWALAIPACAYGMQMIWGIDAQPPPYLSKWLVIPGILIVYILVFYILRIVIRKPAKKKDKDQEFIEYSKKTYLEIHRQIQSKIK